MLLQTLTLKKKISIFWWACLLWTVAFSLLDVRQFMSTKENLESRVRRKVACSLVPRLSHCPRFVYFLLIVSEYGLLCVFPFVVIILLSPSSSLCAFKFVIGDAPFFCLPRVFLVSYTHLASAAFSFLGITFILWVTAFSVFHIFWSF